MTLGDRLRRAREHKKLSQRALAKLLDIAPARIAELEGGVNKNPTLQTLEKLAAALDVTVVDLLSEDVPEEYSTSAVYQLWISRCTTEASQPWEA